MGGKSCFFIGHREASEEIYPALYAAVEQHILEYGVTEFIVGHYGGFDRLAASAVREAKRFYPEVRLILLLPYHPAERPIPMLEGFDGTFYSPGMESVPRKVAIVRANRYVVDHVDLPLVHSSPSAAINCQRTRSASKRICAQTTIAMNSKKSGSTGRSSNIIAQRRLLCGKTMKPLWRHITSS